MKLVRETNDPWDCDVRFRGTETDWLEFGIALMGVIELGTFLQCLTYYSLFVIKRIVSPDRPHYNDLSQRKFEPRYFHFEILARTSSAMFLSFTPEMLANHTPSGLSVSKTRGSSSMEMPSCIPLPAACIF